MILYIFKLIYYVGTYLILLSLNLVKWYLQMANFYRLITKTHQSKLRIYWMIIGGMNS